MTALDIPTKIVVTVYRGVVKEITSNNPDVEVEIIDHDIMSEESTRKNPTQAQLSFMGDCKNVIY